MNMHVKAPQTGNEAIPSELLTQELARQATLDLLRRLRREARDEIERLLSFLDESDIDPDLEPSLGFVEAPPAAYDTSNGFSSYGWPYSTSEGAQDRPQGSTDDRELDDDDREPSLCGIGVEASDGRDLEDDGEHEPSLGSCERGDQTVWAAGNDRDLEDDHDGREPDDDDEPSLGWTDVGQIGNGHDYEVVDHLRPELTKAQRRYRARHADRPDGCRMVRV